MQTINITQQSKELFIKYANDAGNWSGCPLVGGNVADTKENAGNLTQLKRAQLLTTHKEDGDSWINFTPLGFEYAASLGITIRS